MAKKSDKKEHPRRRSAAILDAAAEVFATRGFHGASTQDIADVLGIKQASLYYYFPSKEVALEEVCLRGAEGHLETAISIASALDAARDKVRRLIAAHLASLLDRRPYVRTFLNERQHLPTESRRRIGRLSRAYERAFLTHVGPHALENAALAEASRRAKAKAPEAKKRRSRQAPAPKLPLPEPALPQSEIVPQPSPAELELPALDLQPPVPLLAGEFIEVEPPVEEIEAALPVQSEHAEPAPIETTSHGAAVADADTNAELASDASDPDAEGRRPTLAQKVRAWLGRAA